MLIFCQEMTDKSDEELALLSVENQNYFMCLMQRYESKLLKYIKIISGLKLEDCEDLLQDVFIKTFMNLRGFSPDLKFSSWIYRITHNHVISNYRKIKSRGVEVYESEDQPIWDNLVSDLDASQEADLSLLKSHISKILDQVDVNYREVLILRFWEDKDYQEISDILQKPVNTVGTLLNRAKKQFLKISKNYNLKE
jgi:RNA polymerase sigma-70 factor (ECF subfamily)